MLGRFALAVLVLSAPVFAVAADPREAPPQSVKGLTEGVAGTTLVEGVVDKIDADGMTVVEVSEDGQGVTEHRLTPVDLLKNGKLLRNATGCFGYRWEDVKRGDRVRVETLKDKSDGLTYCLEISIRRRPGATLPKSQIPNADHGYLARRILNDLDNGENVTDEDIKKAFPPRDKIPGGLWGEHQEKLDAIRAKKDKEKKDKDLKATPPEKK